MSKKRSASSYDPADSGFAKYFLSMLDDGDRNRKYSDGIRAAIDEFITTEGRAPRVVSISAFEISGSTRARLGAFLISLG